MSGPLVYQSFVARALRMSWAEARAFVEAQGYETFARGASSRTWAMSAADWQTLATRLRITETPATERTRIATALDLADLAVARPGRRGRRRRVRGNTAPSA